MPTPFNFPLGTPGFNPNAPDPRIGINGGRPSPTPLGLGPQGPGTPQGPPAPGLGAPPPAGAAPGGLVDGLATGLQGIGDIVAAVRGGVGPTEQRRQAKLAEYQRARQEMLQNLALAESFGEALQRTPVEQLDARRESLGAAFERVAPGQRALYDAITSEVGLSKAMVETMRNSEALKVLVASGATSEQLTSPEVLEVLRQEAHQANDAAALPVVKRKFDALRNSTDPRVRTRLAEIMSDKLATVEEFISLSEELGTEGPEGTKLTPAERDAARRGQDVLREKIPGLTSSKEFEQERELDRQIRLEREKAAGRVDAAAARRPQSYGAKARDEAFAKNVYVPLVAEGGYGEIDRSLAELDAIIPRLEPETKTDAATGRVIGRIPRVLRPEESVDIERRVARIVQTDLRRILGGQFAQKEGEDLLARSYDRTLDEALNAKTLNDLRTAIRKEYAAKKAAAAYFEANGGSLEGYSGMKDLESGGATTATPTAAQVQVGVVVTLPNGTKWRKLPDGNMEEVTD